MMSYFHLLAIDYLFETILKQTRSARALNARCTCNEEKDDRNAHAATFTGMPSIRFFLSIYASEKIGMSAVAIGGLVTLSAGMQLLVNPVLGRASNRLGQRRLIGLRARNEGKLVAIGTIEEIIAEAGTETLEGTFIPLTGGTVESELLAWREQVA